MTLKTLDSCSLVITGIFASFLLVACQPSEEVGGSDMPVSDTSPMDVSVAMPTEAITTFTTEHLASKSSFYIGGEYLGDPPVMGGQMYVDVWEPNNITQPYPIVLFPVLKTFVAPMFPEPIALTSFFKNIFVNKNPNGIDPKK